MGAIKTLVIDVMEIDIKRSRRNDPYRCPVARAIRHVLKKNLFSVAVVAGIRVGNKSTAMPKRVLRFIQKFDRYEPVKPFSFRLPVSITQTTG